MNAAKRYREQLAAAATRRRQERQRNYSLTSARKAAEIVELLEARGFPVESFAVAEQGSLIEVTFVWPDLKRRYLLAMPAKTASSELFGDGYRSALKAAGIC